MRITAVTRQKKRENRLSVYIDDKFAFGMTEVDALYYHIKEGDEITEEQYNNILNELVYAKARDKAVKLLGISPRSEKELYSRLNRDYSDEICQNVISMLKSYGYINDADYAAAYVNDSFKYKGWGSRKIKAELRAKGVDETAADTALQNAELDEESRAKELLKKRLKGCTTPDIKEKNKQYRYLLGRGFSYDTIKAAFAALTDNSEEDDYE